MNNFRVRRPGVVLPVYMYKAYHMHPAYMYMYQSRFQNSSAIQYFLVFIILSINCLILLNNIVCDASWRCICGLFCLIIFII
jgi:hypothetical protein